MGIVFVGDGRFLVSLYSDDGLVKTHCCTATNNYKECDKILDKYRNHESKYNRKIIKEEIFDRELMRVVHLIE